MTLFCHQVVIIGEAKYPHARINPNECRHRPNQNYFYLAGAKVAQDRRAVCGWGGSGTLFADVFGERTTPITCEVRSKYNTAGHG